MKKILSLIIVVLMTIGISACSVTTGGNSSDKADSSSASQNTVHKIGETQTLDNISITAKSVANGLYCDGRKSSNGTWVRVNFTVSTTKNYKKIYYTDFTLNDSYTIRKTTASLTNIPVGGFTMVEGNEYEFYVVFDSKYSTLETELTFMWTNVPYGKKSWYLSVLYNKAGE